MAGQSFAPDVVIGIGREGGLVGALLGVNWRLKPFCVIDRDFVFDQHSQSQNVEVKEMLLVSVYRGKKVLLVDCEVNTGETLKAAKAFFEQKGASIVRTMALARSKSSRFLPDYCAVEYTERLFWPWEYTPEIKHLRHHMELKDRR